MQYTCAANCTQEWEIRTFSLTDPKNPAFTEIGNFSTLRASGLNCIFLSSTLHAEEESNKIPKEIHETSISQIVC
jgi:hypothetical protein